MESRAEIRQRLREALAMSSWAQVPKASVSGKYSSVTDYYSLVCDGQSSAESSEGFADLRAIRDALVFVITSCRPLGAWYVKICLCTRLVVRSLGCSVSSPFLTTFATVKLDLGRLAPIPSASATLQHYTDQGHPVQAGRADCQA